MTELTIFNYKTNKIRTIMKNGESSFVAKDAAEIIGVNWQGAKTISHVPDIWRGVSSVDTPSGVQEMAVLTEQGLYFFLARSDKAAALPFQMFIAGEVLPQIRKTGSYTKTPQTYIQALEALIESEREKERLALETSNLQIELDKSKEYYTIKRVGMINGISGEDLSWRRLEGTSRAMEHEIKKVFDANYGNVKAYHIDVWRYEYPELRYCA
jgi:prophage antirepressor-like protein